MARNVDNIGGLAQAAANLGSTVNRRNLRFLDGGGVAWSVIDDPLNNEVEVSAVASGAGVPPGALAAFAGTVAPSGWLECDGASYTTAAQPTLFAAIGYIWGGAGPNFNVPDFSRRVPVGRGGAGTAVLGNAVGNTGGEESHVQTVAEMASHAHTNSGTHNHNTTVLPIMNHTNATGLLGGAILAGEAAGAVQSIMAYNKAGGGSAYGSTTSTNGAGITVDPNGSSTAANVMQPSAVVMWIIKT